MTFTNYRLEHLPCAADPHDVLLDLPARLQSCGFGQKLAAELQERFHLLPDVVRVQAIVRELEEARPAEALARLFWFSQPVSEASLLAPLGRSLLQRLLQWGLLVRQGDELAATVDLQQIEGCWLATDRFHAMPPGQDIVYSPGRDSLAMARWTPRWSARMALDLGTGSGIQALLCASRSHYVEGFDINPRAVDFARFNAQLNGRDRQAYFFPSDLYQESGETRYDVILSNPPWVPAPGATELFRGGGANGEALVERICRGLGGHLQESGRAAIFVEYPKYAGSDYLQRVRSWLDPGPWGIALLHRFHFTTREYVGQHTGSHVDPQTDFPLWIESYERQGILGMGSGELFLFRLPPGQPEWAVERYAGQPTQDVSRWVERWLEACLEVHRPGWRPGALIPEEDVQIWRDGCRARAEWPDGTFPPFLFEGDDPRQLLLAGVMRQAP